MQKNNSALSSLRLQFKSTHTCIIPQCSHFCMRVILCGFSNVVNCVGNILQVEYMLVEMDDKNEKVCLVLNGKDVLETLQEKGEKINPK